MAAKRNPRRRLSDQAQTDSERLLLTYSEIREARDDIEQHDDNSAERAKKLGRLLDHALGILNEIRESERAKRKLADETLPRMVNGSAGKADAGILKRLVSGDMVEKLILIGVGGAIYAVSPDFFKLIIGLLAGNAPQGG
jgi:hypothetical protein